MGRKMLDRIPIQNRATNHEGMISHKNCSLKSGKDRVHLRGGLHITMLETSPLVDEECQSLSIHFRRALRGTPLPYCEATSLQSLRRFSRCLSVTELTTCSSANEATASWRPGKIGGRKKELCPSAMGATDQPDMRHSEDEKLMAQGTPDR